MKYFSTIVFLLLFYSIITVLAQEVPKSTVWENGVGKSRWDTWHLEKEDVLKMKEQWDKIGDSLKLSSNEFAGTYFKYGYMSGYFLRWSPEAGFIYIQYFDVEHPCSFSYGKVSTNGLEVNFIPAYESTQSSCVKHSTPKTWIPADSGRYLIPAREAKRFGNFYAGLGEFNGFPSRWSEEHPFAYRADKDFKYSPKFILPPKFEEFIERPIEAKIISVGNRRLSTPKGNLGFPHQPEKVSLTPVTINVGRKNGVKNGMEFLLTEAEDNYYQTLIITRVMEKTSQGVVIREIDDKGNDAYPDDFDENTDKFIYKPFSKLMVGMTITTSPIVYLHS
jgi:hypothetical protein